MRRIIGIDPGSRITGFGIIDIQLDKTAVCVMGGCIRLTDDDLPSRLSRLFSELQGIVLEYKPSECAIEQVFVHKNAQSALKLGHARGVAIAAVMTHRIAVYEYAPRQIKQAIVGKGAAQKGQVQHMIQMLLKLSEQPQADAADALAIALCHYHSLSSFDRVGESAKPPRRRVSNRKLWTAYDKTITRNTD